MPKNPLYVPTRPIKERDLRITGSTFTSAAAAVASDVGGTEELNHLAKPFDSTFASVEPTLLPQELTTEVPQRWRMVLPASMWAVKMRLMKYGLGVPGLNFPFS